jgi:hypothetical protein
MRLSPETGKCNDDYCLGCRMHATFKETRRPVAEAAVLGDVVTSDH